MKKVNTSGIKYFPFLILLSLLLALQSKAQISCSRNQYYALGSDGLIYSLTINGNTVSLGSAVSVHVPNGRFGLAIADMSGGNEFYSSGTNTVALDYDILKYTGGVWQTLLANSWTNPLHN